MSPRKTILKELSRAHEQGGGAYTRPSAITGFGDQPDKYQKAVNELLAARLVEGRKDDQGHMTIALNSHRLRDVKREIRPFWARPSVWAVVVVVLAIGAGLTVI
jgi:hypothetical protein